MFFFSFVWFVSRKRRRCTESGQRDLFWNDCALLIYIRIFSLAQLELNFFTEYFPPCSVVPVCVICVCTEGNICISAILVQFFLEVDFLALLFILNYPHFAKKSFLNRRNSGDHLFGRSRCSFDLKRRNVTITE